MRLPLPSGLWFPIALSLSGCPGPVAGETDAAAMWPDRGLPGDEDAWQPDAFVPDSVDASLSDVWVAPSDAGADARSRGDAGMLPGDIILTGTPEGVSNVAVGDEVVCEIDGIGRLVNTLVAEP